jgi:hypothetical protein
MAFIGSSESSPRPGDRGAERRRRFLTRALPIAALAALAFVVGVVVAAGPDAAAAERFVDAWVEDDYEAMHAELTPEAQDEYSPERLARAYADAADTATISEISPGDVEEADGAAEVVVDLQTNAFGALRGTLELPLSDDKIAWEPHLVFPGLEPGEALSRLTRVPRRAPILAADGSPLAEGPAAARSVPSTAASNVVGAVGEPTRAQAAELARRGFPPGTLAGNSGLELAYEARLAGQPGGQLLATRAGEEANLRGGRVLAASRPRPGKAVRTTIDPGLQGAAVSALGSLYGGVAVIDARKGSILALAGIAYSAPQPPGSTFKVITATGALDEGIVKLADTFPVESSNSDIGREIANSHDAPCGGTFTESFAKSCNTVFAPLGAELGGPELVGVAERYGFNTPPPIFDPAATAAIDPPPSTIPPDISTSVEVGESAIGQGQVLATPLQLASIAQTIANGGVRMPTPIAKGPALQPAAEPVRVTSQETANTIRDLMIQVVESGTGVAAGLPGIAVAGKTGTAELGPAALEEGQELGPGEDPPQELDAWFTAFAPAAKPSLAIGVMVVNAEGDGGEVAAPIAAQVLSEGLGVD